MKKEVMKVFETYTEGLSKGNLEVFDERSDGTFRVITNWAASNDCFVAASVVSLAERDGEKLHDPGIDLFRIKDGKIQEVWTFAEQQDKEDKFWG